jgi:hypothetical protein
MILYTMMPNELIFPPESPMEEKTSLINYQGIPLLVEKTEGLDYRIIRVFSTDPQHFLDERFSPGAKISF